MRDKPDGTAKEGEASEETMRWEIVDRAFIGGPLFRNLTALSPDRFDRWYVIGPFQLRRRIR